MSRFDYAAYDDESNKLSADIRTKFTTLTSTIEELLVDGRAKALVLTKLEEAFMWVGKSIRDTQLKRG